MEKTFANKVALVTGGSFGIGKATALAFARRGANVVVADIAEDAHDNVLNQIYNMGSKAIFIRCDISDSGSVKAMIDKTIATFGRIDYAFNNAGIEGKLAPTHECTEENFLHTSAVNLTGAWLCMKYELEHMLRQGQGCIVNNSSVAGLKGFASLPAYVASKHGLIGLTKTAAIESAGAGIRVNAICPGVIRTDMIDRVTGGSKEIEQNYIAMEPVGRMGTPDEIAEAVVWLCSDAASFVTGAALAVDGGLLA